MKNLNTLIENRNQTGMTEKPGNISNHSERVMVQVWRGLSAFKMVHEPVGSTDYKYWDRSLAEFTDEDLIRALKLSADHKGYLTIGDFRALCVKETPKAAHQLFLPKQSVKASKETRAKYMAKLRDML